MSHETKTTVTVHDATGHTTTTAKKHKTKGKRRGGLPSSEKARSVLLETEKAIRDTQTHPPHGLDSQGRKILSDLEHLTIDQRRFIEEKNHDDVIQKFAEEARLAMQQLQHDVQSTTAGLPGGVDRETADRVNRNAARIVSGAQLLVKELASSGTFRTEMQDLINYLITLTEQITGISIKGIGNPLKSAINSAKGSGGKIKPEKMKEAALETKENLLETKQKLSRREPVRPLTEEERCILLDKISQLLYDLTAREQSREVIKGIVDLISLFATEFKVTHNAKQAQSTLTENKHIKQMLKYLQVFIGRFTGQNVMDKIEKHAKALAYLQMEDPDVRKFFRSIKKFIMRRVEHPGQYDQFQIRAELEKIVNRGRYISNTKDFGYHLSKLMKYVGLGWRGFSHDPQLVQFQRDIKQLVNDLTFDQNGNFHLTTNSIQQLRIILVSTLVERMSISIPPIQSRTEKMDLDVSNIYLEVKDIIPEQVNFKYKGHMNVDTKDLTNFAVDEGNKISIMINNVKFSMHNLHVWWHRKTFPKTEDSGKLDINMPGDGLDIKIVLDVKIRDANLFTVRLVDARIDKLKLHVADTKHDFIFNTLLKVAGAPIKKKVQTQLQDKITNILERLNVEISRQAKNAMKMSRNKMSTGIDNVGTRVFGTVDTRNAPREAMGSVSKGGRPVVAREKTANY